MCPSDKRMSSSPGNLPKNKGQSLVEYIILLVFILGAMLVFQKYMAQALYGRMKGIGDGLGQGRIYDPKSINCSYDDLYGYGWYDADCAYDQCTAACFDNFPGNTPDCSCFGACKTPLCD